MDTVNNGPAVTKAKVAVNPIVQARNAFMAAVGQASGGSAFLLQVGANDGLMADPAFAIAKRDNWRGLLIEPHPVYFAKLQERYHDRSGFALLQIGISDVDGVLPLYHLNNERMQDFPLWVHGCASLEPNRLISQVKSACHKIGLEFEASMVASTVVPLRRLDAVLAETGISQVDIIVIDVEGHELQVMASADLSRLNLRGMLVECNGSNAKQKPEYVAALNAIGMTVYQLGDDLCAFDPARLSVDLAAEFDAANLPHLGK